MISIRCATMVAMCLFVHIAMGQTTHYDDVLRRDMNAGFVVDLEDDIPAFEVETLDGDVIDTDVFAGQVLLIQFVASWCPYSADQMQSLEHIRKRYEKDVSVLVISVDDRKDQDVFKEKISGIDYPFYYAFDPDERVFKMFSQSHSTLPRVVIVNKRGKIVGLFDEHSRRMVRIIRRITRKSVWG